MRNKLKNINVLHIAYSDYIGGASRAVTRIHSSLVKSNINSSLLVQIKSKNEDKKIIKIKNNKFLQIIKILINKLINLFFKNNTSILSLNIFNTGIVDKINNSKYDIIHLHWINNETISIDEISKIKKKIVWTCHDMWPFLGIYHYSFEKNSKTINFIDKFILEKKKKLIKKKIYFVGVSSWIKKQIKKSIFKKNHAYFVNNPIDLSFWKPIKKSDSRKILKLDKDKFYIGVGNLEIGKFKRKGLEEFIKAINLLKTNKNIEIIEFGNEKQLKISNISVRSFGIINDDIKLRQIYNSLDLFVLPSKIEAFGQVASEAILCGTPVVGFANTGLDDIIINKFNGLLASNFSYKNLSKSINYFINNDNYNKFKIRNTIVKKFSYKRISTEYIKIYKKIINEKN